MNPILNDLNRRLNERIDKEVRDFIQRCQWMDLAQSPEQLREVTACIIAAGFRHAAQASLEAGVPHKSFIQGAHEIYNKLHQKGDYNEPRSNEPADFKSHRPYKGQSS